MSTTSAPATTAAPTTSAAPATTAAPTTTEDTTTTVAPTTTVARPVNPIEHRPEPELLAEGGFSFLDGVAWSTEEGALFFTDAAGQLLRLGDDDSVTVVAADVKTRDLQFDDAGRIVATETDDLRVTATNPDGSVDVLAADFEGLRFAAPNGVAVRSDGTVYFTDFVPGAEPGFDFRGVFAISPSGTVTAVHRYAADQGPNGIALSPDDTTLYVGNSFGQSIDLFDIAADGTLSAEPRDTFSTFGFPDGICVDDAGNVFVASISFGIEVFASSGAQLGIIDFPNPGIGSPGQMSNCEVGGDDGRDLFVLSASALYRVRLA